MIRKSAVLLALFFLYLSQLHAQKPQKIKVARPKSNTPDTSFQRIKEMKERRQFPDLQDHAPGDLGVVFKSPRNLGLCAGTMVGLFLLGKDKIKAMGFSGYVDVYIKESKMASHNFQLGIWYWTPDARKFLFNPTGVYTRDEENDRNYFSIKPEVRYIITRKLAVQAGLQLDLNGGSGNSIPQLRLSLLYRLGSRL